MTAVMTSLPMPLAMFHVMFHGIPVMFHVTFHAVFRMMSRASPP